MINGCIKIKNLYSPLPTKKKINNESSAEWLSKLD